MVTIWVNNGLGNQMFQYALGTYLVIDKGIDKEKIFFDNKDLPEVLNGRQMYRMEDIFLNSFQYVKEETHLRYLDTLKKCRFGTDKTGLPFCFFFRALNRNKSICYFEKVMQLFKIDFEEKMKEAVFTNDKNYFFFGYWEKTFFLDAVREQLITDTFKFKYSAERFGDIYYKIITNNSVAIHVRRGDFVKESDSFWKGGNGFFWDLCDKDYYEQAMQFVEQQEDEVLYVFFSDDVDYVKRVYKNVQNKIVVCGNRDYEDLQLMALCKHNIIANSTFSFWGAYLNSNKGIVVAPKIHYLYRKGNKISVHPFIKKEEWHYIDNTYSYNKVKERGI